MLEPANDTCRLMLKTMEFVEGRKDGAALLETLFNDGRVLFGVTDVAKWTGWSAAWIRQLCQENKLPHIPGKEIKFLKQDVMEALAKMQRGGKYRKRSR